MRVADWEAQRVLVLRGPTSLGNNQALFVVDGIPINNGTSNNVQSSGNFFDNV